jgi:glutamate transport system ATP-binding protein
MDDGQIVEEADPDSFFTKAQSARAKDFLSKILTH